jgi:hypothetical protein
MDYEHDDSWTDPRFMFSVDNHDELLNIREIVPTGVIAEAGHIDYMDMATFTVIDEHGATNGLNMLFGWRGDDGRTWLKSVTLVNPEQIKVFMQNAIEAVADIDGQIKDEIARVRELMNAIDGGGHGGAGHGDAA